MDEDDFIRLVKQAEQDSAADINQYRRRLFFFALLGYAVIFGVFVLLIALISGSLALALFSSIAFLWLLKTKLLFAGIAMAWVLIRALWIRFEKPQGYEITAKDCPELFREINSLRKSLKSLPVHRVILTSELNAAVVQHPRLGILGFNENILFLGIELLLVMPEAEMRAILAHELGHLSVNHSAFDGWIYRVRQSWGRIREELEKRSSAGAWLMGHFFNWYEPRFAAYSYALARNDEYEADRISALLTSADTSSRALIAIHAVAPIAEQKYWDEFFNQADQLPEPPHNPLAGFVRFLRRGFERKDMLTSIRNAMTEESHYADTHPCLKERLQALGAAPQIPALDRPGAAHKWLGKRLPQIVRDFDQRWLANNKERWRKRYDYVRSTRKMMNRLENVSAEKMDDKTLWQLARALHEFESGEAALVRYKEYLKRHPEDAWAAMNIAVTLQENNDEAAVPYFHIARKEPELLHEASDMAYQLLNRIGKPHAAERWLDESRDLLQRWHKADAQAQAIDHNDRFTDAGLSAEQRKELRVLLYKFRQASGIWIARKVITDMPEYRALFVLFKRKGLFGDDESASEKLQKVLSDFSLPVYVLNENFALPGMADRIRAAGEKIFPV